MLGKGHQQLLNFTSLKEVACCSRTLENILRQSYQKHTLEAGIYFLNLSITSWVRPRTSDPCMSESLSRMIQITAVAEALQLTRVLACHEELGLFSAPAVTRI